MEYIYGGRISALLGGKDYKAYVVYLGKNMNETSEPVQMAPYFTCLDGCLLTSSKPSRLGESVYDSDLSLLYSHTACGEGDGVLCGPVSNKKVNYFLDDGTPLFDEIDCSQAKLIQLLQTDWPVGARRQSESRIDFQGERKEQTMKKLTQRIMSLILAVIMLQGAVPAHAAGSNTAGLNGDSGKWAEFDESVYDEVISIHILKNAKVNGYTWPASGTVLVKESSSTYTLTGSQPNCIGITIPGGLVVDIYKYYQSAGMSEPVYKLLGHFDTTDGSSYTIGTSKNNTGSSTSGSGSTGTGVGTVSTVAGFSDVRSTDYYAEAVKWAKENGVTAGSSATTFSPNDILTRAQAMTFLWNAVGQPDPASSVSPFTDVVPGSYYYKAVLWAAEQGITSGVSSTMFGPEQTLPYDQILTFLCHAAGGDVSGDWSAKAIAWASVNGLTDGLSFSAKDSCPRSDVVYCLWKQLADESSDQNTTDKNTTDKNTTDKNTADKNTADKNTADKNTDGKNTADKNTVPSTAEQTEPPSLSSLEAASAAIINGFLNRESSIAVGAYNIESSELRKLADEIADINGKNPYNISLLSCNEEEGRRALFLGVYYLMQTQKPKSSEEEKALATDIARSVVNSDMSDYEIVKALHDWLVLNCEYDMRLYSGNMPYTSYTAYGALADNTAVCQGYALAYQALLEACGIECEYVSGRAKGGRHGWNIVKVDGQWYHVDTTWDDPIPNKEGYIRYNYFLRSDAAIGKDHSNWSASHACTSTKYDGTTLPNTTEQAKQEAQREEQERLKGVAAEALAFLSEAVDNFPYNTSAALRAAEELTSRDSYVTIDLSGGQFSASDLSKIRDQLKAEIAEKYPDYELMSINSSSCQIKRNDVLEEMERRKAVQQAETEIHAAEIEELLKEAIKLESDQTYTTQLPETYAQLEIAQVCKKMNAAGYSFDGYTAKVDYVLVVKPNGIVSISNKRWTQEDTLLQEQEQREEQERLEEERKKQEALEEQKSLEQAAAEILAILYEAIDDFPYTTQSELQAEEKTLSNLDANPIVDLPTTLPSGQFTTTVVSQLKDQLKEAISAKYPDYELVTILGLRCQIKRNDVLREIERRNAIQQAEKEEHIAQIETLIQQAIRNHETPAVIPENYTNSEVSLACRKMRADGYSFDGYTPEDYALSYRGEGAVNISYKNRPEA